MSTNSDLRYLRELEGRISKLTRDVAKLKAMERTSTDGAGGVNTLQLNLGSGTGAGTGQIIAPSGITVGGTTAPAATLDVRGSIAPYVNAGGAALFALDGTAATGATITNGSTFNPFTAANNFGGLFFIHETSATGQCVLCILGAGIVTLVAQSATVFVQSNAPGAGKIGIYLNASTQVEIKNNFGSSVVVTIVAIRTRSQA